MKSASVKPGPLGGHWQVLSCRFIDQEGNRSFRGESRGAPKWAVAPSCLKMKPSASGSICGNTKLSSISRQTAHVLGLSWEKQGPTVRSDVTPHLTLISGTSQTCSAGTCGFSQPQILQLQQLATPCVWTLASSETLWLNDSRSHAFQTCHIAVLPYLYYSYHYILDRWRVSAKFSKRTNSVIKHRINIFTYLSDDRRLRTGFFGSLKIVTRSNCSPVWFRYSTICYRTY